jgi:O-antigen ligase
MNALFNTGLFLMPALSLGFRPVLALFGILFACIGIYRLATLPRYALVQRKHTQEWPLLACLLVLALCLTGLNLFHGERWSVYHLPVAIFLNLPIFWALRSSDANPRFYWEGASAGALIAAAIAGYEVVFLGAERAGYLIHNPIPFGSISMCLAAASVIGYRSQQGLKSWSNLWALTGLLAGVTAAVLSGSKGCLLALPVLAYLVHIKCIRPLAIPRVWLMLSLLLALAVLTYLATDSFLAARIEDAARGAMIWLNTGKVAEGSVGPRLELIRFAFDAAMVNPLTGVGRDGMVSMLQASATNGAYDPFIAQLHTVHNELLNIWVTKGLLGLLAMSAMYGLSLRYFWRIRHHANQHVQNIGLMGMSLCLMYLIFGLSEVALQLTFFRNFFLVTLVCLLGMAFAHKNQDVHS